MPFLLCRLNLYPQFFRAGTKPGPCLGSSRLSSALCLGSSVFACFQMWDQGSGGVN